MWFGTSLGINYFGPIYIHRSKLHVQILPKYMYSAMRIKSKAVTRTTVLTETVCDSSDLFFFGGVAACLLLITHTAASVIQLNGV